MTHPIANHHSVLSPELQRLQQGRHHDPFELLGIHRDGVQARLRVMLPGARQARVVGPNLVLERIADSDILEWQGEAALLDSHPLIAWTDEQGVGHARRDPYSFASQLSEFDLHLFSEGRHWHVYRVLGAHPTQVDGIKGVRFAVWAPNAERVSLVGEFNQWDGRSLPMRSLGGSGVWELFVPDLPAGALYRYEIRARDGSLHLKSDPYANEFEQRPGNASRICTASSYRWSDQQWLAERHQGAWQHAPVSIYEVHLGSWVRNQEGGFLNYRELAYRLASYFSEQGFTHVELLPITEHPLDDSWGYQSTGYFAPTSRFGTPDDFRFFVDHLHQQGIGVILDWVPAHFPRDTHALARFDGTALYEHADPRRGEHRDWGTYIFNYGRAEVRNFLISSAIYWLEEFHLDGLRVDAVASMLYLDYSREPNDWIPNQHGGRENLEAVEFLRELNRVTHQQFPGSITIAEESTAWPQVSRPTDSGGLGFSMKWNMGWMHDTLSYMAKDPLYRKHHHEQLTFGQLYAYSENFVLPFSHDEVVHGKGSLLGKMPGDEWQRRANLRLLLSFQMTYPGKKLQFMGNELAQPTEWNCGATLQWSLAQQPEHGGIQALVRDLNRLYREQTALHRLDFFSAGFEWLDCHDANHSTLGYLRRDDLGNEILVILNFTPVPRLEYRLGVPEPGCYRELLNSDSRFYGGSDLGNGGTLFTENRPQNGHHQSLQLVLPPLAALILQRED